MDVVLSGRYKLISTLGQGGMSEVWRGLDTMLNRPVAVKLIRLSAAPSAADYDDAARRFRREAQAVAALNHPNIVTAYDFGIDSDSDTPYLVMEMIEGRPLAAELAERAKAGDGPLPAGRVLAIAADVCAGLSAAHAVGVVHRDLKPANLMTVARTGRVKIVDFGIARGGSLSRVTQTGSVVGTVAYIAPETLTQGEIDGRADLYGLGCVLFELLTGRSAYNAVDPAQFMAAHLHGTPTPLRQLLPEAPEALEALLLDMLAKEPARRPANADEVALRLGAALSAMSSADRSVRGSAAVPGPGSTPASAPPAAPPSVSSSAPPAVPQPREPSGTLVERLDPAGNLAGVSAAAGGAGSGAARDVTDVEPPAAPPSKRKRSTARREAVDAARADDAAELDAAELDADSADGDSADSSAANAGASGRAVNVAAASAIPDAPASSIPAQRSGDADVRGPGRSLLHEPLIAGPTRRPSGRTVAVVGVVLAVVVAGVVWLTSGAGGHSPAATPKTSSPAGPAVQPTSATSPSIGPSSTGSASASASPDAFAAVRTMAADPACGVPSQLSFNPNGTQLAGSGRSAGGAGTGIACVWSVGSGALAYKATGYRRILGAQFDPGNGDLAYATSGNAVPLLIGAVGAVGNSIKGSISSTIHMRAPLEAIAVAPDGRTVAVSYTDSGTIQYYDAVSPHWLADVNGGVVGATGTLTYSPSGSRIAHAEASGVVVLSTSSPAGAWHGPGATAAAFLTDSELVTCSGSRISVYDVTSANSTPLRGAPITGTCAGIAVHPATHQIAVSTIDHGVVLLTLPSTWK